MLGEWQLIETAPMDGTEILTYRGAGLIAVASAYKKGRWCIADGVEIVGVSHWMPLPDPPQC